ncbi:MAG TPA: phospholipase [Dehalococcoidia bacterium]|nr:phospholipase [Dehalococcoidia bacterium]
MISFAWGCRYYAFRAPLNSTFMTEATENNPTSFREGARALAIVMAEAIEALDGAFRRLDEGSMWKLQSDLGPLDHGLNEALKVLIEVACDERFLPIREQLISGAEVVLEALGAFTRAASRDQRSGNVLQSMRSFARGQELLYSLRSLHPRLGQLFAEPAIFDRLDSLDEHRSSKSTGIRRSGPDDDPDSRGEFHLYVPESLDGSEPRPLVVALHGGMGYGRDFLWTWLREARSRRFVLLAPTSVGPTWALMGPDADRERLMRSIEFVSEVCNIDGERIFLTGLSDGGTYGMSTYLSGATPFAALAVVAGVLHPKNIQEGAIVGAEGKRISITHGAKDWMFPVQFARAAYEALGEAGADVRYQEIADLAHAYPREENPAILEWFDPTLAITES